MAKEWTVDEILDMGRSFQSACILTAAAELDIQVKAITLSRRLRLHKSN